MQRLLQLIVKFHFVFIFIALELFCFYLIIKNRSYHQSVFFNYTYELSGRYYNSIHQITSYLNLKNVNDSLMAENARLRTELLPSLYNTMHEVKLIKDTIYEQKYEYIPAEVINNSVNLQNNYITIDKGKRHGLQHTMGVISPNGVTGIVRNVSNNFSSLISVLHKDFRISAKISETNFIGSLSWSGENPDILVLNDLPLHYEIKVGQKVVTSPYSRIFPENIPIGYVEKVEIRQTENFYTVYVRSAVDFRNLNSVYIVKNIMSTEQQQVEKDMELW